MLYNSTYLPTTAPLMKNGYNFSKEREREREREREKKRDRQIDR